MLGGAPCNFAYHAGQILTCVSLGKGIVASRIGDDPLGQELLKRVQELSLGTDHIQRDPNLPTSTVRVAEVKTSKAREVTYEIKEHVAWDHLEWTDGWHDLAAACDAVCFGTLAQRSQPSRNTIQNFLKTAKAAFKICDLNLRPPFFDGTQIVESLQLASALKLNVSELQTLQSFLSLSATSDNTTKARVLLEKYDLELVLLTKGANGTTLILPDSVIEQPPHPASANPDADSVGAGDACCAAITCGYLGKLPYGADYPTR